MKGSLPVLKSIEVDKPFLWICWLSSQWFFCHHIWCGHILVFSQTPNFKNLETLGSSQNRSHLFMPLVTLNTNHILNFDTKFLKRCKCSCLRNKRLQKPLFQTLHNLFIVRFNYCDDTVQKQGRSKWSTFQCRNSRHWTALDIPKSPTLQRCNVARVTNDFEESASYNCSILTLLCNTCQVLYTGRVTSSWLFLCLEQFTWGQ